MSKELTLTVGELKGLLKLPEDISFSLIVLDYQYDENDGMEFVEVIDEDSNVFHFNDFKLSDDNLEVKGEFLANI